ncbi:MAG: hypothetical protein QOH13_378, partial [Thermoleophilaceae bacterium]|nr:hypothetical protein [Thermoleophilaceae bacterium]
MSYLRGHHVARFAPFVSAGAVALICVCPAAALATTGTETVQATQADTTHVSVSLTDSDPSGTNPVNGLTFKTDGSLTSASVSGTPCSATGVGDAEYCSVTQAPGQTLDATLTVTKPVSMVNICGTTDGFVTTANTTCTDNTVNQPSAPPPPPPPPGGTTPPGPVMDCDDFFAEKGPSFPTSIDPYKGAVVSLPFLIHNAGNCPTAADTRVKFTGASPESERSGYRYLSPGV